MQKVYIVNNLDCANCGGKIEAEINKLESIEKAVLNFTARKLKVTGNISAETERQMQKICDKIENGVVLSSELNEHSYEHKKTELLSLIAGVILFFSAIILSAVPNIPYLSHILYFIAYIILGYDIIISAFKGLFNKNLFDENFLMTIATVGALILGEYSEAIGVVLFFKIGSIFEHYAVEKSRKQISSAINLCSEQSEVLQNGEFISIDTDKIEIGDIIRIKTGERIPVDAVVKSGEALLDTSAINGEPIPISVKSGDSVISGYINTKSVIEIEATATLENSMLSKIAEAIENASDSKPEIDRFITKFSKVYTPIVIVISLLTAIIPSLITGNYSYWIYTALTFLVISCPCALVLSVPLAYFSGIGKASKSGILFKGGNALETLHKVKAVAFDKTGTVTKGIFTVTECKTFGEISEKELLSLCGSCESASTHPVAVSITDYCKQNDIKTSTLESITEIAGMGIKAVLDNKTLLCGNEKLMRTNGIEVNFSVDSIGSIVILAIDNKIYGYVTVSDIIKENSESAIRSLKDMGIKSFMLTGDKSQSAEKVAESTGIENVYSELLPHEKLEKIQNIRNQYGNVMFVGDGINDAPVLAGADIGGAMQSGSDLAIESADVVFMKSDLESVVTAKKIADYTDTITKQNIIFALAIKLAVMVLGLFGIANMWFAVFADSGVAMLLVLNSIRILFSKNKK